MQRVVAELLVVVVVSFSLGFLFVHVLTYFICHWQLLNRKKKKLFYKEHARPIS